MRSLPCEICGKPTGFRPTGDPDECAICDPCAADILDDTGPMTSLADVILKYGITLDSQSSDTVHSPASTDHAEE